MNAEYLYFLYRFILSYSWALDEDKLPEKWSDHDLVCYKYLRRSDFPRAIALASLEDPNPEALWDNETDKLEPSPKKTKDNVDSESSAHKGKSKRKSSDDVGKYLFVILLPLNIFSYLL